MFGKRTAQPGAAAPAQRPAQAVPPPVQPAQGLQTQAFSMDSDVSELERPEPVARRAPSEAADRLDALASRPRAEAPAPKTQGPGPKATPGFEQLKKAQAVAEIVREQSDYYHATKTTIFNALMNTIDLAQLAQLEQKAAAEEIRDIVAELVAIKNVSMS
ncbi:MAG: CpaF family protein, partial [Alphaproteobacteria bacterium]